MASLTGNIAGKLTAETSLAGGLTGGINLSGEGTDNYNDLDNKPSINGVILTGNKTTSELHIEGLGTDDYRELNHKPSINGHTIEGNMYSSDLGISYNDLIDRPTIPDITPIETAIDGIVDNIDIIETDIDDLQGRMSIVEGDVVDINADISSLNTRISGVNAKTLPAGGSAGQVLQKYSGNDYAAEWSDAHYLPSGGSLGDVLVKYSDNNYEASFQTRGFVPSGGSTGEVLKKVSSDPYDVLFEQVESSEVSFPGSTYGMSATTVEAGLSELNSNLATTNSKLVKKITITKTTNSGGSVTGSTQELIGVANAFIVGAYLERGTFGASRSVNVNMYGNSGYGLQCFDAGQIVANQSVTITVAYIV